jgi:hypothetical protein
MRMALLVAGILGILCVPVLLVAPAEALNLGAWVVELPGAQDPATHIRTEGRGGVQGIVWAHETQKTVGFGIREPGGQWTIRSHDISGNGTQLRWPEIARLTDDMWIVSAKREGQTQQWIYRTENRGTTFSLVHVFADVHASKALTGLDANAGVLAIVYIRGSPTVDAMFAKSIDNGETWTQHASISDNTGSPTGSPTQRLTGPWAVDIAVIGSSRYAAVITTPENSGTFGGGAEVFEVTTEDAGVFWTTPYTTEGGSTLRKIARTHFVPSNRVCATATVVASAEDFYVAYSGTEDTVCKMWLWKNPVGVANAGDSFILTPNKVAHQTTNAGIFQSGERPPFWVMEDGQTVVGIFTGGTATTEWTQRLLLHAAQWDATYATAYSVVGAVNTGVASNQMSVWVGDDSAYLAYRNPYVGGRFEVAVQKIYDIPSFELVVSELTGVAFAPDGSYLITREGNGVVVKTYSGTTLHERGSVNTPNCFPRAAGVDANGFAATFLDCDGDGDVQTIRMRSPNLGLLPVPKSCEGVDHDDSGSEIPDDLRRIHNLMVGSSPWMFCVEKTFFNSGTAQTVYTFTDQDGNVGAYARMWKMPGIDAADFVRVPYGDVLTAEHTHTCHWQTMDALGDIRIYMVGVHPSMVTRVWEIAWEGTHNRVTGLVNIEVRMEQRFGQQGLYDRGKAVDCTGAVVLQQTEVGKVQLFRVGHSVPSWQEYASAVPVGGLIWEASGPTVSDVGTAVALSKTGRTAAYLRNSGGVTGPLIQLVDASDGTLLASFAKPQGELVGLGLDNFATRLVIVTSDRIVLHHIGDVTKDIEDTEGIDCDVFGRCVPDGGQDSPLFLRPPGGDLPPPEEISPEECRRIYGVWGCIIPGINKPGMLMAWAMVFVAGVMWFGWRATRGPN